MSLVLFFFIFLAGSAVWAWIIFGDGAERLEDNTLVGWFIGNPAADWPASVLRFLAWVCWIGQAVWLAAGLIEPALRWI